MNSWNYQDTDANKASDEFKSKYMIGLGKRDKNGVETQAITVGGLITLGHSKKIKSLITTILQYPNAENENMCIVQAVLKGYDYDPKTKTITDVEYSAIGDASPRNCSSMVAPAFIRMAETRAIGRVLRFYTGTGNICSDEIGDSLATPPSSRMTKEQLVTIKTLQADLKLSNDALKQMSTAVSTKDSLQKFTFEETSTLINLLAAYKLKKQNGQTSDSEDKKEEKKAE